MKKITITTPENTQIEYNLASVGSRAAAACIDMMIQFVVIGLVGLIVFLTWAGSLEYLEAKGEGWIIGGAIILLFIVSYGYFIFFEMKMNGRTPGKKLFKLRTLKNNGQPIDIKSSIIRNLFRSILDDQGIGVVAIFLSKEHKRVGDYAASTMVVVENQEKIYTLEEINMEHNSNLSKDEKDLLKDYERRKNQLGDSKLKEEIEKYFEEKDKLKNTIELEKNKEDIFNHRDQ
ncbi:MAG: RDD family protein [Anaeromicrobium sp.]|uniref:RDD family protein n=1 Tax=Anaeromicrobium sp. TaxID=1929132 RepID=UPI0025EE6D7A|nr:RDD family protein [Anaeromicrobium sp.]MCT4593274.1 RDD family protein [Anaeromicrobium sp.]